MSVKQVSNESQKATFGGGCFWCMVQPFQKIDGVIEVVSGYAGGTGDNPTYEDFVAKGYIEVVQVVYDPAKVDYETLLTVFWQQIDPTDPSGQFYDRGFQYQPIIFYHTHEQKTAAELSKIKLQSSAIFSKDIAVAIKPFSNFYPAEQYHQDFYKKNPEHYQSYRTASGRDTFLQSHWNTEEALKKKLNPLEYDVIRCRGTEPSFDNAYWNMKEPGIYVDKVSGEPLFSSLDKYDSGTGWPSFTRPLDPTNIIEKEDLTLARPRIEVKSKQADSHLGHVFPDGPEDQGGMRYCINSAALRFIPVKDLEKEGYGNYLSLFD